MNKIQTFETDWGGKKLIIEIGKFANQASGSCTVQYGDTVILATATMSAEKRDAMPYFPLMVDYEEKLYAAGRIKGSRFIKTEGRPTDEAILTARFIDRALRPLFDDRIRNDIQIIITTLAFDEENDPDILGLIGASCALCISDIPWAGPIACIRIGQINGEWVINPSYQAREKSILDLAFAGTPEKIIMVEAGGNEVPEETVLEAFWFGQKHLKEPMQLIEKIQKTVGKEKRDLLTPKTDVEKKMDIKRVEIEKIAYTFIVEEVKKLFFGTPQSTKSERNAQKSEMKAHTKQFLIDKNIEDEFIHFGTDIVLDVLEEEISRKIIEEEKRVDGRSIDDIRTLLAEIAVLPRIHGTGHFMRGETQVLTTLTLGAPGDEQTLDGMEIVGKKRYFHHYNFPPYSVGEVKPLRGPSRRDIGHGGLAEKALRPMIPDKEAFPYTIRTVSEVFGSNGSSSMASTCGSTLALMDGGVPIKAPVAGIAMGLASDEKGRWKVLTDLQDLEDGKGGMDFKIAGSRDGITAIQMDTKTHGLTPEIISQAVNQAKSARMRILDVIEKTIASPRAELSQYAPRIITLRIKPEQIGNVIGPGGKMINEIIATTGVQAIDIDDDGLIMITSKDADGAQKAKEWVENLTKEAKIGEVYKGKVVRIMDFGAIVEFLPKQDGMVHVSNLAPWRVEKVTDIVKMGDSIMVKIMELNPDGKISLSMKDAPGNIYPERPPMKPGGGNNGVATKHPTHPKQHGSP